MHPTNTDHPSANGQHHVADDIPAADDTFDPTQFSGRNGSHEATAEALDPFGDLSKLRLSGDFATRCGVQQVLTDIAVRKPHRQEFFRVQPGWTFEAALFTPKDKRDEVYFVHPRVTGAFDGWVANWLFLAISRGSKQPFVWPIPMPDESGRSNKWHESARAAAEMAETQWLRMVADMQNGLYSIFVASATIPDPTWPELTQNQILRLGFKAKIIDTEDHPIIRALLGEA